MEPNTPQKDQPNEAVLPQNPVEQPLMPEQPAQAAPDNATTPATAPVTTPANATPPPAAKQPIPRKMLLIGGGVLFLLLIIILGIIFGGNSNNTNPQSDSTPKSTPTEGVAVSTKTNQAVQTAKATSHVMVYGVWTGQTSAIKTVDLTNSTNSVVATLPLNVEKITVLDDKNLLYIDQTDTQGHGKRVSIYNLQTKNITNSFYADDNYYINDYVLSPNKKYIAIWELSLDPKYQQLQGGRSRIIAIDLTSPTITNTLFDEDINTTIPVHYPRAILDTGTLLTDTYMASDPVPGGGWEYGMNTVDIDGTNSRDIDTMQSGTYSSQPTLSPDGKYLLFTGYDGSKGDGKAIVNGKREVLLTPNTVELLNTKTLKRFRLPNVSSTNLYSSASWDLISGNVIITVFSGNANQAGLYVYDLAAQKMQPLSLPSDGSVPFGYISQLPQGRTLIGITDNRDSSLGNLGDHQAYAYSQLSVLGTDNSQENISVEDPFVQYITLLPGNYFQSLNTTHSHIKPTPFKSY
jgi:hypothetical protein